MRRWFGWLLAGALSACNGSEKPTGNILLELDGCQEVVGERCVLRSRPELTLWIGPLASDSEVRLLADGRRLPPKDPAVSVQDGIRLSVALETTARRLEVRVAGDRIRTIELEPSPWPESFVAAVRAAREHPERATALFAGCPESLGPRTVPACWTVLAKALPTGSPERQAALERAIAGHRAAGHRLGIVDVLTLAARDALERADNPAAKRLLAALPPPPWPPRAHYLAALWQGAVARDGGDFGRALDRLGEAVEQAERLGRDRDRRDALELRAVTLQNIGRFEGAAELFEQLTETALPAVPCDRARLWSNVGWTRFLAREQEEAVADPLAAFAQATAELAAGACPAGQAFNLEVNRAAALLQAGRTADVPAALAAAATHQAAANGEQLFWFALVEARAALARGDTAEALERFDGLAEIEVPEARWRARFGRALAIGNGPEALAELAEIDALLEERLARIPAGEGREWFIAQSEPVVRRRLDLLLDREEVAFAFELARRARARVLRGFAPTAADAREEFAGPAPGELLLAFHPLDAGAWVAFAAEPGRPPRAQRIASLPRGDRAALAAVLLDPFRAELARAERVRISPYGRLREVDFHTLPVQGQPLLGRHAVVYGLDLPVRPRRRSAGRALVVGDPRGDLPQADREAREVAALLTAAGYQADLLVGLDADATTVRERLAAGVEILHFAGHAAFAGPGGFQSELRLARGTHLTLEDLLALDRAPDWVVLSACESGATTVPTRVDGLGLAQTFLIGGSRAVVATTRPIADEAARPLVTELYHAWLGGADLPNALARAQVASLARGTDEAEVAAFRILEP